MARSGNRWEPKSPTTCRFNRKADIWGEPWAVRHRAMHKARPRTRHGSLNQQAAKSFVWGIPVAKGLATYARVEFDGLPTLRFRICPS